MTSEEKSFMKNNNNNAFWQSYIHGKKRFYRMTKIKKILCQ